MQISRAMLRQGLEDIIQLPKNSFSSIELSLKSPRFFSDFSTLEDNFIYLSLTPLEIPDTPLPSNCVVFLPYSDGHVSYNINIIHIPPHLRPERIFNRIISIFDRWSQFRDDLSDMLDQRQPVDAVLKRCTLELGNPVYLHNHQYEILARSEPIAFTRPDQMNQMIRALNNDPVYRSLRDSESFFSIPASFTEYPFLCCNVWSDKNHFDYRIVLAGSQKPLTPADESAFRLLCGFVQRTMRLPSEQQRLFPGSADTQPLRELFSDILHRNSPDYLQLGRNLAPYGWLPEHRFCVLATQPPQADSELNDAALLRQQLEQRFPYGVSVMKGGLILLIVNLSQNGQAIEQLLHSAVYFLRDNFLKVGISNVTDRLHHLQSCCDQAQISLEYILNGSSYAWRLHFRDMALNYILSNCSGQLSPQAVCSQKLLRLRQYDTEHNTELYQTLRCYIECHFNALEATRKLFIHRSTFLYRLERAKSLFFIDLDDPDELLHIMISIRLLDQAEDS